MLHQSGSTRDTIKSQLPLNSQIFPRLWLICIGQLTMRLLSMRTSAVMRGENWRKLWRNVSRLRYQWRLRKKRLRKKAKRKNLRWLHNRTKEDQYQGTTFNRVILKKVNWTSTCRHNSSRPSSNSSSAGSPSAPLSSTILTQPPQILNSRGI